MKPNHSIEFYLKELGKRPELTPRPQFRTNARIRILNQLDVGADRVSPVRPSRLWRLFRWFGSLGAALALAGTSVAYAAQGSAPGSALYPVKLKTEEIAKTLSPTAQVKTDVVEAIIERRASEVEHMETRKTDEKDLQQALERYEKTVNDATVSGRVLPDHIEEKIQTHSENIEKIKDRIKKKHERSDEKHFEKEDREPSDREEQQPETVTPVPTGIPEVLLEIPKTKQEQSDQKDDRDEEKHRDLPMMPTLPDLDQ